MRHSHLKTVAIANEVLFGGAIVVPEHLLIKVPEQMERLYVDVCAFQSALEQAPEILQSVCMHLPVNIALSMVNRLVDEILIVQSPIGHKRICCRSRFVL